MNTGGTIGASPLVRISNRMRAMGTEELLTAVHDVGETSRVVEVGSTGATAVEPLVTVTVDGRTALYPRCDGETARRAVESLDSNQLPTDDAVAVVEYDPETARFPCPESGPLAVGDRRVLGACGWVDPTSERDYRTRGGWLCEEEHNLQTLVDETGIRGRGRGDGARDAPVETVWQTATDADGDPVVVVNANEADPQVNADTLLLRSDPFAVVDPAVAVAKVVGATDVVVYVNETETTAQETATAVAERVEAVDNHDITIDVVVGPDEYRAGEPTMALESLEGNDRIEARRTPPGPAEHGLFGRPTVIHTPRTLAQLRQLVVGEGIPGMDTDPGTRLHEVHGDTNGSTVVELPTGADLSAVVEGVASADSTRRACVGGVFGGLTASLDVPTSVSGLTAAGLGTNGAVELLGDDQCPVALAGRRAKFAREENCGRCVPCREGSKQLTELLRETYDDQSAIEDVRELARVMNRSSLCAFGQDAARPVRTALNTFESEFLAHASGRCPSGECTRGDRTGDGHVEGSA